MILLENRHMLGERSKGANQTTKVPIIIDLNMCREGISYKFWILLCKCRLQGCMIFFTRLTCLQNTSCQYYGISALRELHSHKVMPAAQYIAELCQEKQVKQYMCSDYRKKQIKICETSLKDNVSFHVRVYPNCYNGGSVEGTNRGMTQS